MRDAITTARQLGVEFAAYLNETPAEAQNWRLLDRNDDLPTEDYRTLAREFGDVTAEMDCAYRDGFNSTFTGYWGV